MPTERKFSVMFARFPSRWDHPDVTDWLVPTYHKARLDPRIGKVHGWKLADTPVTMTRNRMAKEAIALGVDFVCIVDDDMSPDIDGAKPFWDTSFDFIVKHYDRGPCLIAAPYCGPPPYENVFIFRWAKYESDRANPDMRLDQITREDAARRGGIEQVAALPTGLMLIDVRAFSRLAKPYFYYEWKDDDESEKASTEDVTFTRDCSLAGVPCYCNWDSWAGHWKWKRVRKPQVLTIDNVREEYRQCILNGFNAGEQVVMIGEGGDPRPAPAMAVRPEAVAEEGF